MEAGVVAFKVVRPLVTALISKRIGVILLDADRVILQIQFLAGSVIALDHIIKLAGACLQDLCDNDVGILGSYQIQSIGLAVCLDGYSRAVPHLNEAGTLSGQNLFVVDGNDLSIGCCTDNLHKALVLEQIDLIGSRTGAETDVRCANDLQICQVRGSHSRLCDRSAGGHLHFHITEAGVAGIDGDHRIGAGRFKAVNAAVDADIGNLIANIIAVTVTHSGDGNKLDIGQSIAGIDHGGQIHADSRTADRNTGSNVIADDIALELSSVRGLSKIVRIQFAQNHGGHTAIVLHMGEEASGHIQSRQGGDVHIRIKPVVHQRRIALHVLIHECVGIPEQNGVVPCRVLTNSIGIVRQITVDRGIIVCQGSPKNPHLVLVLSKRLLCYSFTFSAGIYPAAARTLWYRCH